MLDLNIHDETSRLKAVVLGTAESSGPVPRPEEAYDPKSLEHILAGTYPSEEDMVREMVEGRPPADCSPTSPFQTGSRPSSPHPAPATRSRKPQPRYAGA